MAALSEDPQPHVLMLQAFWGGTQLAENVVVGPRHTATRHPEEPWKVHWAPRDGGPYPIFDGELTVRADNGFDSSILDLSGYYRVPGIAEHAIDAALAKCIASTTAATLLADIANELEERFRAEVEEKKRFAEWADSLWGHDRA
jgi:hypothetical protein